MKGYPKYKKSLLQNAFGNVLEINAGTCSNLNLYDITKVKKLTAIDYQLKTFQYSIKKESALDYELKMEDSENLTFKNDSFDCVVDTFGI